MSQAVGQIFAIGIHGLFGWICNPAVVNIRIFNPCFVRLSHYKCLYSTWSDCKSDRTGATSGATLGATNSKDNRTDNQCVKCRVCWVSPTVCQCMGARVRVYGLTSIVRDYKSQYSEQLDFEIQLNGYPDSVGAGPVPARTPATAFFFARTYRLMTVRAGTGPAPTSS